VDVVLNVLAVTGALVTCKIRKAPLSKFIFAAVRISPDTKLAGRFVGVAMSEPYSFCVDHVVKALNRSWLSTP
jgi:hypothetical protein